MPPSDIINARLLFVDDEQTFLDFIHQTFTEFSRNQWEMKCVPDAAHALAVLRSAPVDLAILDLNMPGVNGLQLLRMLRIEFPALQMAFLTGQGDEKTRRIGLEEGAALFLEKPASLAGMESLFATLNELARWQQRTGERGVVRRAGLLDLVKMECKSGNSRVFEILGAAERGQIWIKAGDIIHALAPAKRGQSAFTHLVCLPDAEFHLKPFLEPIERSVSREWEFLVLEAARVLEQRNQSADAGLADQPVAAAPLATSPVATPPAAPAPAAPALRIVEPAVQRMTALAPEVPVLPAVTPPLVAMAVFPPVAAALAVRPLVVEPAGPGLQIEEMLLCSDRREVYYEWQCVETQKWLGLIEFLAHKTRQMGYGLPLGKFDRLELQSDTGRLVVQHQQNRFVLIRSNTRAPAPGAAAPAPKTIAEWLAQQSAVPGLLAYGVSLPDRKVLTQAFDPDIPLTALNTAWPCVTDTFETAIRVHFPAWQQRWIFERAQLYCVRRADGASLGLLLEKSPAAVDLAAVERLFAEFQTLRAA